MISKEGRILRGEKHPVVFLSKEKYMSKKPFDYNRIEACLLIVLISPLGVVPKTRFVDSVGLPPYVIPGQNLVLNS